MFLRHTLTVIFFLSMCSSCWANGWLINSYAFNYGPDVTAPTVSSTTANADALVINYDESVSQGAGYADAGIDVDCSVTGADITVTYVSGNGTSSHTYLLTTPAVESDVCDLDFNGDADSLEDAAGNDLAAIVSGAITNNTPAAGGSCTAGLLLAWHMENEDLSSEDGCSILGDTVFAANASASISALDKSDGSNSVLFSGGGNNYQLDISQNFSINEGRIIVDFKPITYVSDGRWLNFTLNGDNIIFFKMVGGSGTIDLQVIYEGNNVQATVTANTNINEADAKWWRVDYQYNTAASAADHKLTVTELDASSPRVTTGSPIAQGPEDDITAMTGDAIVLNVGATAQATAGNLDRLYYYNVSGL